MKKKRHGNATENGKLDTGKVLTSIQASFKGIKGFKGATNPPFLENEHTDMTVVLP